MAGSESLMTLLTRHRIAKGMTQEQLAARVGVDPSTISFWEAGKWRPHPGRIKKLARILGIDPMTLTRVIEPDTAEPAVAR